MTVWGDFRLYYGWECLRCHRRKAPTFPGLPTVWIKCCLGLW